MSLTVEMTSFGIDLVKDRKSVLNMMSYIFSLHNPNSLDSHVPDDLQKLLNNLPFYAKHFFTDNIGQALGFLRKSKFTADEIAGGVGSSVFYFRESNLWKRYKSREFLYFCACYIPKAVQQYYEHNDFTPATEVYDAIIRIIKRNRQKALFSDKSWETLDEISSHIVAVETIHKEELERLITSTVQDKSLKNKNELVDERRFLLELMKYISSVYFKSVPSLIDRLHVKIPNKARSRFTPAIKKATLIITQNQFSIYEKVKREGVLQFDQWLTRLAMSFHARDFLECCSCLAYNRIKEYYEDDKLHSPLQAYQAMLYILKQAKDAGMFITLSWEILEKVATQITAEVDNATESFDDALLKTVKCNSRKSIDSENTENSFCNIDTGSQITLVEDSTSDDSEIKCCCVCS